MEEKATCVELVAQAKREEKERQKRRERLTSVIWGVTMFFTFVMALVLLGLMVTCLIFMVAFFTERSEFATITLHWIIRFAVLLGGSFVLAILFFILGMRCDDGAFVAMDELDFETEVWDRSSRGLNENVRM